MTTITASDGLTYTYEDNVLTISGNGASQMSYGRIDSLDASDLTQLIIEPGVTTLASNAFRGCDDLVNLNLGTIRSIGLYSFVDTTFTEIRIPSSVISISEAILRYNRSLTKIIFEGNQPIGISANAFDIGGNTNTIEVYSNGWADSTTFPNYTSGTSATFVYITGIPTYYAHVEVDDYKCLVDAAIRDGAGHNISAYYAPISSIPTITNNTTYYTINFGS